MLKGYIQEFVKKSQPTFSNFRLFCIQVFDSHSISSSSSYKAKIRFLAFPGVTNASVWINKRKRKAIICCNLWNVLNSKMSVELKLFQLCTSVLHELEHLHLLSETRALYSESIPPSMALYEQIANATDGFLSKFLRAFFSRWSHSFSRKIHMSSAIELLCMKESHSIAYDLFAGILDDDDQKFVDQLCQAISLMEQCNEIKYVIPSWPLYKFAYIFAHLQKRIVKKAYLLDKYPALRHVFISAGYFRSLLDLCEKATSDDSAFYSQFIMRLFIEGQSDIEEQLLNNNVLFQQIEKYANMYCQLCVDFVKNKQLCKKWFDEQLVEDNVAMMIKNYKKLDERMQKIGMRHYAGSLFPMYLVR